MQGMKLTYVSLVIIVGTSSYTVLTQIFLNVITPLYTRGHQNQTFLRASLTDAHEHNMKEKQG